MNMTRIKRGLALLLTVAMLLGVMPMGASAAEPQTGEQLEAMELPAESRLELRQPQQESKYKDNEMVTVIVLMEGSSVLAGYEASAYAVQSTRSAGEAVSEYLTSAAAQAKARELRAEQNAVIEQIRGFAQYAKAGEGMKVKAQWTGLVNAISVEIPYGQLEKVRALPGVRHAYVEQEFERPTEPAADAGIAGYSYDQVNLNSAWSQGYYGEGMLVAVLDTGLDIEYTTWGDSANPNTGVRRAHAAFTENSFRTEEGIYNVRYTESGMAALLTRTQLYANLTMDGGILIYDGNALYKNRKVPFAFDYADWDANVRTEESDHGTHVAGTIAGYAVTEEGEVIFSGVAPDAQILAMKVFDDAGTSGSETAILCALEDAVILGADVINLSLGADNGLSKDNTAASFAYQRLKESGVLFMVSAGNAGYSSANNDRGDYYLSSDPEMSMVGSPSTYYGNISVASVDNTIDTMSLLSWTDTDGTVTSISYADPFEVAMKNMFTGVDVPVIPVDGYGTYSDYYNAGFRGYYGYGEKGAWGIALVKRGGGLTFEQKINQATSFTWSYYDPARGYYVTEYPIKAVIIYDEDPNATELIYMSAENALLTCCFINGQDGHALAEAARAAMEAGTNVTLTAQKDDLIIDNATANQMSVFSSWGATPALELKPDITAPGGNIWSAVVDQNYSPADPSGMYDDYMGSYAMMSGTSMAAPHMTGITALVRQYVTTGLGIAGIRAGELTENLLVSTAVPLSYNGTYYSPRVQGAGLVNAGAAIASPAYITVEGQNVGKIELLDDPQKTGAYTLTFTVHNLSGNELTYNAQATLLRPATETAEDGNTYILDSDVTIKTVDLGAVVVPANGTATVSQTVTLTDAEKAEIDSLFPNGAYIEGFVVLSSQGQDPQIGLPFLGYYGDWTAAPIFDSELWLGEYPEGETFVNADTTWGASIVGYFDGYAFYNLGQNPFDSYAYDQQNVYMEENITISPTGLFRTVNDHTLYQLRDAKLIVVEVKDKETGELYFRDYSAFHFKTFYNYTYGTAIPSTVYFFTDNSWDGTDLEGNVLPSGTQCVYTITAYGDGEYPMLTQGGNEYVDFYSVIPGETEPTFNGHAMDMTGDVIEFDILVDTVAPKLINSAVTTYVEDGRTYLTGTFVDDGSIASVEIYPQVKRSYNLQNNPYADPSYFEYGVDDDNPFYCEMIYDADVQEWTFIADVTEYAHTNESYSGENHYYNFDWTGNVFIYGGDYGGNDRAYGVTVTEGEGLILSTTSAKLYVGDSFDLSVIDNTGSDEALTRVSTNPEVASVDEFGHVVALAPGQTEIVISNGTDTAICIVAVLEKKTEIIDFKLSLESFDGLKPDGSITVRVTDIEPADAVITENVWKVYENDEEWAGLLSVSKNSSSGLEGSITLMAQLDDGEAPSAGAGYLEVTLNGVTRRLDLSWDELYDSPQQDGLISAAYYNDQVVYVKQGETAQLIAKYRQNHSFIDVELYTAEGYESYSYNNPTTEAVGVVLDGPTFVANGATWTGKLVALPGYELPTDIKVVTRYDYGYESEMMRDGYYNGYTYDSATGEIVVKEAPYGATNILAIRADGVAVEGAPGGSISGTEYPRPDGTYGPFNWTVTQGEGELTTGTVEDSYEVKDAAFFTPSQPGVSYITASSSDGKYSVNFAVVCAGVQAEKLDLAEHKLTMYLGNTFQLEPTLTPEPTLDADKRLVYTSFNEDVVTVDENGLLTAVAEGYAYISIEVASGADVETYCVVQVMACMDHTYGDWEITTEPGCETEGEETRKCTKCGHADTRSIPAGHTEGEWTQTQAPTCTDSGTEVLMCSVCSEILDTRSVPALGHDYEDGICKRCGDETELPEDPLPPVYLVDWVSGSTTLDGTINLNFYVKLSANIVDDPTAFVRFTYAGNTVDVPMAEAVVSEVNGVVRYRFGCELYAKQMADTVTAQVMNENGPIGEAKSYSVMQYCLNKIAANESEEMVALAKAMLNYGAAAQVLFGYNTENLANASLSAEDKALADVDASAYKYSITGSEAGIKAKSATLMLESEVAVRVYFKLEEGADIASYTFTVNGEEVAVQQNEKGYYIESAGIAAKDLDEMLEFSVGGLTVTYGALSYVNSKAASSNADEANMAKALFAYYSAAESYFG